MLVLSRQRDESIMIGDDVEVTIVDVWGDKVRLGITAPREIPVHRREIYDLIKREKEEKEKRKKEERMKKPKEEMKLPKEEQEKTPEEMKLPKEEQG